MHKLRLQLSKPASIAIMSILIVIALSGITAAVGSRLQAGAAPIAAWSFNEGSGSVAYDQAGANDGTITGASWKNENECKSGKCLSFDASGDYVTAADSSSLSPIGPISLISLIKPNSVSTEQTIVAKWDETTGTDDRSYRLWLNSSAKLNLSVTTNGSTVVTHTGTKTTFVVGQWYAVAGVVNTSAGTMDVYVNGVLDATQKTSGVPASIDDNVSNLYIGGKENTSGSLDTIFNGSIDQMAIYNYARSASQIKSDYSALSSSPSSSSTNLGGRVTAANDGLVGHWKMDETTWTVDSADVVDSSGAGNTGTVKGSGTDPVAGKYGKAGSFDGSTDYVQVSDTSLLRPTTLTVSAWIYTSSTTQLGIVAAKQIGSSFYNSYVLYANSGKMTFTVSNTSGSSSVTSADSSNLPSNAWTHYVGVYNGSNSYLYKNGILLDSDLGGVTIDYDSNPVIIGADDDNAVAGPDVGFFTGSIDDVKIYNKARSSTQIAADYQTGPPPVAHWKMDDNVSGAAQTIKDTAGLNNGTTYGSNIDCTKAGKYGKGCKFLGSAEYISAADSSPISPIGLISLIGWIRPTTVSSEQTIMAKWDETTGADDRSYRLWLDSSNKLNMSVTTDGSTVVTHTGSNTTFAANTWYHVAGIVNPTTGKMDLYVNGVLDVATKTSGVPATIDDNASNLYIGGKENTSGSLDTLFAGIIDDVRIYNYARTQQQIQQDMLGREDWSGGGSQVMAAPRADSGTVGWWDFDESNGSTALDKSSLSNTLTMTAGATGVNTAAVNMWDLSTRKYGKSGIEFDGDDYLTRADDADFDFAASEDFSITGWFKHNTISAEQHIINKFSSLGYKVYMDADGDIVFGIDDDATSFPEDSASTTSKNYDDNAWHQFIGVKTGTTRLDLYIDGVLVASDTSISSTGTLANAGALYIGVNSDGTSNDWDDSYLDSIKIYRSALTASDAKTAYNRNSALNLGYQAGADPSTSLESSLVGNPPVGHWSFDEGSGSSVPDRSGNNNDGTWNGTGSPHYVAGKYNWSGKFNGTDDYVTVASPTNLSLTTNFTISSWFKFNVGATYKIIYMAGTNANRWSMNITNTGQLTFSEDAIADNKANTVLSTGAWYYGSIVKSGDGGSNITFYINGIQDGTATVGTVATPTGSPNIGSRQSEGDSWFNGQLDDVKIYNYARSQQQIAYDYNKGLPVSWWKMDEGSGNTAYDYMKRNNGTLSSGGSGSNATSQDMWDGGASGKYNRSLEFDGTDDYVYKTISDFQSYDSTGSISAWVKTTENSTKQLFSSSDEAGIDYFFALNISINHKFSISSKIAGSTDTVEGSADINGNTWHHVTATSDGSSWSLYVDGKLQSLSIVSGSNSGEWFNDILYRDNVVIGALKRTSVINFWPGQIDDVRVYNYALSPLQVKKVFNEGASTRFGPSAGLP